MRKSAQIIALEARLGRPLAEIVANAYTEHQTVEAAAASIGVNPNTFAYWLLRLPIDVDVRKVASVRINGASSSSTGADSVETVPA
jgi:hypothetical protein